MKHRETDLGMVIFYHYWPWLWIYLFSFQPSTFFTEQLTAFEVWLDHGSEHKKPPEQLPIVLQVCCISWSMLPLEPSLWFLILLLCMLANSAGRTCSLIRFWWVRWNKVFSLVEIVLFQLMIDFWWKFTKICSASFYC